MKKDSSSFQFEKEDGQKVTIFERIDLNDYEKMKKRLTLRMIPIEGNEEMLTTVPHKKIEDMAMMYCFEIGNSARDWYSIQVNNNMLRGYGITQDQLERDAINAAMQRHPASLRNLNEVMREMMGEKEFLIPDEASPMWLATVEGGINGACVLRYPNFLDQAADILGGDFYILPSSVHEVLLVADDGSMQLFDLEQIVHMVNETKVAPKDRLSDQVFHYDSEAHIFENARTFEQRESIKENAILADETEMAYCDEADDLKAPDTVTILLIEPNNHPKVIEAEVGLKNLQKLVGGDIEVVYPFDDNVALIVNEEGKLNGLPLNRAMRDEKGEIYDVIAGSFLVAGLTEDSFGSLTNDQISKFEELFHQPEVFVRMGRKIMAISIPEEQLEAREAAKAKELEKNMSKSKNKCSEHNVH